MTTPFFLLGAPKCATSSIYEVLSRHPQVWCPRIKEPGYFTREELRLEDRKADPVVGSWDSYWSLYGGGAANALAWCDASTSYLRSRGAIREIRSRFPDAKALVMVRDPVELVSSYYTFLRYQGWEDQPTLEAAWSVQERRRVGMDIPPHAERPSSLVYADVALLGAQVEFALSVFGADLMIRTVEDLKCNTAHFMQGVLNHIGVDPGVDMGSVPSMNHARRAKSNWVNEFVTTPPPWLAALRRGVKSRLGVRSLGIRAWVDTWNSEPVDRKLNVETQSAMREFFRADVEKLSTCLSRDLFEEWNW